MTAPIWRFVLSSGLCGDNVVSGVLMPSVDRVGRQFPLALVALLSRDANPWDVFLSGAEWFVRLEDLALSSLDDDFDFDGFDDSVAGCGLPPHAAGSRLGAAPGETHAGSIRWRFPVEQGGTTDAAVVHHVLSAALSRYSLWWGVGSDRVAPSLLVCNGLPAHENFAALLDGRFADWGWSGGEADVRADAQVPR
jgi:type VI secretion system protein ImpM